MRITRVLLQEKNKVCCCQQLKTLNQRLRLFKNLYIDLELLYIFLFISECHSKNNCCKCFAEMAVSVVHSRLSNFTVSDKMMCTAVAAAFGRQ